MVVVTGGPPLILLLTNLIVLLVLDLGVWELVPEVTVLEEFPLITVNENSGIAIDPLEFPPTTTVLDNGRGAVRMACGGGGAGRSGAGSMGGDGGGDGGRAVGGGVAGDKGGGSCGLTGCRGSWVLAGCGGSCGLAGCRGVGDALGLWGGDGSGLAGLSGRAKVLGGDTHIEDVGCSATGSGVGWLLSGEALSKDLAVLFFARDLPLLGLKVTDPSIRYSCPREELGLTWGGDVTAGPGGLGGVAAMGATGITGTTKSGVDPLAPEKVGGVWVAAVALSCGSPTMWVLMMGGSMSTSSLGFPGGSSTERGR